MTLKKDTKREPTTTVAAVNWEGIARFLGQPIENVDRVRQMKLEPAVSSSTASSKR
jgi:hypothetical protein